MANERSSHELDAPPWLRVETTLMATARALRQAYDRRLEPLGLHLSQASLLAYVAEVGSQPQTRIAERLGLGRAATGSMIDALEARDLVRRGPDPDDRRVWLVEITAAGKELADRVADVDQTLRRELRAGTTKQDRQQLAAILLRLQANLAEVLD
ncbi:MAG: MarR family transcriptional regulator [Actinomycetota bacterium]